MQRNFGKMKLDMSSSKLESLGFVGSAVDTLIIKQQELDKQRREVHALFFAKGISADNAECVTEATARSSPSASFVLFGHSSQLQGCLLLAW
ncbi:hypothetical protein L3X38_037609 [Prunus dulcis]|uniref:Uncharacterized protein n=1 Tax=Prunus dulcis TaxID=3755 RepID=A0AAD4YPQ0_PRUDU|nr:hypothetical protein L3X38_037609 [Prunus dulcis]